MHFFFVNAPGATVVAPDLATYDIATHAFKLIAVSGTIATQMKQAHVNVNNYAEVSRFTGLWLSEKATQYP
jgi:hypothetical protein